MSSKKKTKKYKGVVSEVKDIADMIKGDLKGIKKSLFGGKKREKPDTKKK